VRRGQNRTRTSAPVAVEKAGLVTTFESRRCPSAGSRERGSAAPDVPHGRPAPRAAPPGRLLRLGRDAHRQDARQQPGPAPVPRLHTNVVRDSRSGVREGVGQVRAHPIRHGGPCRRCRSLDLDDVVGDRTGARVRRSRPGHRQRGPVIDGCGQCRRRCRGTRLHRQHGRQCPAPAAFTARTRTSYVTPGVVLVNVCDGVRLTPSATVVHVVDVERLICTT